MHHIKHIISKIKNRTAYHSFKEMPTWLVSVFMCLSFPVFTFFGYLNAKFAPQFFEIGNAIPLSEWTWHAWVIVGFLCAFTYMTLFYGALFAKTYSILSDRVFP